MKINRFRFVLLLILCFAGAMVLSLRAGAMDTTPPSKDYCQVFGAVFVEDVESFADFVVFNEEIEAFADLVVFEESNQAFATEAGTWFFTDVKAFADFSIAWTDVKSFADFSVNFTDIRAFAGCR